jgi:hypothetical protein
LSFSPLASPFNVKRQDLKNYGWKRKISINQTGHLIKQAMTVEYNTYVLLDATVVVGSSSALET